MVNGVSFGREHDDDFKIIREGRIKSFSAPIDRHTDIGWKIEFDWFGRGQKQKRVAQTSNASDLKYVANALIASQNGTLDAIRKKERELTNKNPLSLTIGQLEDLVAAPGHVFNRFMTKFDDTLNAGLSDAKRLAEVSATVAVGLNAPLSKQGLNNAFESLANRVKDDTRANIEAIGRIPAELQTSKPESVSATVRAYVYYGNVQDNSETMQRAATELSVKVRHTEMNVSNKAEVPSLRSTKSDQILSVFVAREGDTPETVSYRFYKTSERGVDILQANRLPWHVSLFEKGQILVIPVLATK
jgi:uncharacterized protein YcfL